MSDKLHATSEGHQNVHLRPEDELKKGFQVEQIFGEDFEKDRYYQDFLIFPDLDGQPVCISRLLPNSEKFDKTEEGLKSGETPTMQQMLKIHGFKPLVERSLSEDEKNRLVEIKKLKIPNLLEGFLLFRSDIDLSQFTSPDSRANKTKLISIYAPSGVGKSLMTALMSKRFGAEPLTFDRFTKVGPKEYLEKINELGLELGDTDEIVRVVSEMRGDNETTGKTVTLAQNLEEMLELFKDGKRPKFMFIESVTDEIDSEEERFSTDCVFIASRDACEARIKIRPGDKNWEGLLYHEDGKLLHPPHLVLEFEVGETPESRRLQPHLVEKYMRIIDYNLGDLVY